jgi:hypothetical protein
MAQKNKKQARKVARSSVEEETLAPAAGMAPAGASRSYTAEFNPDYSQTIKDLKRIGILAGTFFGILIILAIVLP